MTKKKLQGKKKGGIKNFWENKKFVFPFLFPAHEWRHCIAHYQSLYNIDDPKWWNLKGARKQAAHNMGYLHGWG